MLWPDDMGVDLPTIMCDELIDVCGTFPDHPGLGWGRMHPKCIMRLSPALIDILVAVFMMCEQEGDRPRAVALVISYCPKQMAGSDPSVLCRDVVVSGPESGESMPLHGKREEREFIFM